MSNSSQVLQSMENNRVMTSNGWTTTAKLKNERDARRAVATQKRNADALKRFRSKTRANKDIKFEEVFLGQRLDGTVTGCVFLANINYLNTSTHYVCAFYVLHLHLVAK